MIWYGAEVRFMRRTRKVIASGSLPTASFLMKLSLTMATLGAPARSCSSKSRPARNGVCKVSKKVRAYVIERRHRSIALGLARVAHQDVMSHAVTAERHDSSSRGGIHAEDGSHTAQKFVRKRHARFVRKMPRREIDVRDENAVPPEARIELRQIIQAPGKQERSHQQGERKRNLRHNQDAAQAEAGTALGRSPATLHENSAGSDAGGAQCRGHAKKNTCQ